MLEGITRNSRLDSSLSLASIEPLYRLEIKQMLAERKVVLALIF